MAPEVPEPRTPEVAEESVEDVMTKSMRAACSLEAGAQVAAACAARLASGGRGGGLQVRRAAEGSSERRGLSDAMNRARRRQRLERASAAAAGGARGAEAAAALWCGCASPREGTRAAEKEREDPGSGPQNS